MHSPLFFSTVSRFSLFDLFLPIQSLPFSAIPCTSLEKKQLIFKQKNPCMNQLQYDLLDNSSFLANQSIPQLS